MKLVGAFQFGSRGDVTVVGTSNEQAALINGKAQSMVCFNKHCFFVGQVANLSTIDVFVQIQGYDSGNVLHTHHLRPFESLEIIMPLRSLGFAVNGTAVIHAMGLIWETESDFEFVTMSSASKLVERIITESVNMTNGATRVIVDLGVLRAALTSVVPAGFTDIRQVVMVEKSAAITFNVRIDYLNNNVTLDEGEFNRGDFYNGDIRDLLVSNAAQAGTLITFVLSQVVRV